ncbi:hypothetical protein TWF730_002346 [Orbilia blumenaviensis]|uniref:Shugoshin C-terminal domain-containing protein n=1 Tax=Orbilia blumenaviensis TaxID=1796055 RepID=A0AAV9UAC9_9PEZI
MAKLSNASQPGWDDMETLKRRYQRQNRELARANATQQETIAALNNELANRNKEVIGLQFEVLRLQQKFREHVCSTTAVNSRAKTLLEAKLVEMGDLLRSLNEQEITSQEPPIVATREKRAIKPSSYTRERPDGIPEDIPEAHENLSPTTPRMPFVCLGPYVSAIVKAAEEGSPIKDYIPLPELNSAMFDVRPRRKRDSIKPESLAIGKVSALSFNVEQQAAPSPSPHKRKLEAIITSEEPLGVNPIDIVRPSAPTPPDEDEIEESRAALARAAHTREILKELKESEADAQSKRLARQSMSPVRLDLSYASRYLASQRKSLEHVRDPVTPEPEQEQEEQEEQEVEPPQEPAVPEPAPPVETRRALEPKSTNAHVGISPVTLPTAADFEYVKKDKPSPRDRDTVKKSTGRISSKPIVMQGIENTGTEEKAAGTERSRRTRGVAVNYALPALNKKMRRDTPALVDAVTNTKSRRRTSTAEDENVEDIERRTSRMSIHHDGKRDSEGSKSRMTEREHEKMMLEKLWEKDPRMREAKKDLHDFTTADSSAADVDMARRTSLGSHQRRTSGGLAGISAISSKRDGEKASVSVKSASDIIEERRRRRATLAATGASATATTGEAKPRKSVDFAASVVDNERGGAGDRRRRKGTTGA